MFPQVNPSKPLSLLLFLGLLVDLGMALPIGLTPKAVFAHQVEVSGGVAATFHLEPNHNPRAGQESRVWFALTRRGGEIIPLEQCNCQLAVYLKPRSKNDKPLMQPALAAVSAEHYQGIPGATLVFPKAGSYELELTGKPKTGTNFPPFQVSYTVTVR